ncbi:hypothetical protein EDC65_4414 [Stella humosa]|uniref:Anti-sigma factor NepR domain-containing protein n=2 Tax=Stella humosa TaxID=94 RepID=A0A3N1L2Y0_9PROT|nr:hypothetical protein EDC65_4414 [Stella humosa]BBK32974.1 hypothetical protein STHU_36080 [Stella humosa]
MAGAVGDHPTSARPDPARPAMAQPSMAKSPPSKPLPARPDQPPRTGSGGRKPGGPQRQDWLELKLKGLYDEVAGEPLPPSLQKLIDELDG